MKKGMKLMLTTFLTAAMVFGLAACNGTKEETEIPAGGSEDEVVVGMSFPFADHGWMGAVIQYAEDEAKAQGVTFQMTTADSVGKQANDVEDLITKQPDAIVMLPMETEALTPAATNVKDAGIPLVVFDREVANDAYTALIKGDNTGIGENAANYIGEKLGGKGDVVMISAPPSSVNTQRKDGFTSVMKEKYPDIKILGDQNGGFTKEKGYEVMQNFLTANKHIDAVYTMDDEMALGALQAIEESGRTDIKIVTGAGGNKEFYKLIKEQENIELATFTYSPLMVKEAVKTAVELAKGQEAAQKDTTLEAEKVDKENVDSYYKEDAAY